MTLPLFLTRKLKYPVGVALFGIAYVFYESTNHHPIYPPHTLPLTWFDRSVPFLPWAVLIYVSEYLFFTVVYITCKDMENLNKYIYSFFTLHTLSCAIFLFWPTVYPRELFPVPAETNAFLQAVWVWLRHTDAPTNCLPSLHVSSVFLSVFIFLDEQRKKFPLFLIWGTLIALSTLPTKQHYLIDVVTGFALAVVAYWVFHRQVKYRPLQEYQVGRQAIR